MGLIGCGKTFSVLQFGIRACPELAEGTNGGINIGFSVLLSLTKHELLDAFLIFSNNLLTPSSLSQVLAQPLFLLEQGLRFYLT